MNLALINPFITSAKHVFDTVFQMTVDVAAPATVFHGAPSYAVSGVIGVAGDVVGNVSLTFPVETARRIASLFTGLDPRLLDENDIADAAARHGFNDQAHATHDLQRWTGTTPARLVRALRADPDGRDALRLAAAFLRGHASRVAD
mgnify:CR=1 FL=1